VTLACNVRFIPEKQTLWSGSNGFAQRGAKLSVALDVPLAAHGFATVLQHAQLRNRAESIEGLDFWAVSDINAAEIDEFCKKFATALHPASPPS
jgi:hypothetical protein